MKAIAAAWIVFLACTNTCIAQTTQKIGDWTVLRSDADGISAASTTNNSGSSLGYLCIENGNTCGPYLQISVACEVKGIYPLLVNSPVGAFHITTTCSIIGEHKYHLINEVGIFNQIIEGGGEIGFAFPLQDGKFQVFRFSTAGAISAIKESMIFPSIKKNTKLRKDETL